MTKINQHHIPANIAEHALINKEQYQKIMHYPSKP